MSNYNNISSMSTGYEDKINISEFEAKVLGLIIDNNTVRDFIVQQT